MSTAKAPLSEPELLHRLRVRYTEKSGNGDAWAFIPKVRSAAAFDARRTIDAYAMSLWPSRGLALHAFECKSSRSDWQRELKKPAKAEEFCQRADYFWLVVGDAQIVHAGELPETWGLLAPHGKGLRVERDAPRLRPKAAELPPALDRSFLAALLRAACYVGEAQPEEIRDAERRGCETGESLQEHHRKYAEERFDELRAKADEFKQASGVSIEGMGWPPRSPSEIGAAVRQVLDGETNLRNLHRRAEALAEHAQRIADDARKLTSEPVLEAA